MSKLYEIFRDFANWSIGITVSVAVSLLSIDQLKRLYEDNAVQGCLAIALLILTVAWYFLYLHTVRNELQLLEEVFAADKLGRPKGLALPIWVGLSVIFGALISCTTRISLYAPLVVALSLLDLWGGTNICRNLAKLYKQQHFQGERKPDAEIYFEYYFMNPNWLRIGMLIAAFALAVVFTVIHRYTHESFLLYIAYGIIIVSIIISESTIYRWRLRRDIAVERLKNIADT